MGKLPIRKMGGLKTDGAPAFIGSEKGLVLLIYKGWKVMRKLMHNAIHK